MKISSLSQERVSCASGIQTKWREYSKCCIKVESHLYIYKLEVFDSSLLNCLHSVDRQTALSVAEADYSEAVAMCKSPPKDAYCYQWC